MDTMGTKTMPFLREKIVQQNSRQLGLPGYDGTRSLGMLGEVCQT